MDLAEGHLAALVAVNLNGLSFDAFNLGTGTGRSVLEMVNSFELSIGRSINKKISPRRAGDVALCYAKTDKAEKTLGWVASRSLDNMCFSTWNFQVSEGRV